MATSRHEISIDKVVAVIKALDLVGISPENIKNQEVGDDKEFASLPAVSVSGFGTENYDPGSGSNQMTEVGFPVLIALIDSKKAENSHTSDERKVWRETVRDALQHKKWTGATFNGQYDTRVEMGPIIDGISWNDLQLCVSMITVRVFWRVLHS